MLPLHRPRGAGLDPGVAPTRGSKDSQGGSASLAAGDGSPSGGTCFSSPVPLWLPRLGPGPGWQALLLGLSGRPAHVPLNATPEKGEEDMRSKKLAGPTEEEICNALPCLEAEAIYRKAKDICRERPDLWEGCDPTTGMGIEKYRIWSLLQSLFV